MSVKLKQKQKWSRTALRLWSLAVKAKKNAYAPYSRYPVGAAILAGGKIWTGANVENASYGATVCAERVAILQAVSSGAKSIDAVMVVTRTAGGAPPCALCLQVMAEFSKSSTTIFIATAKAIHREMKFSDLLRLPFRRSGLR